VMASDIDRMMMAQEVGGDRLDDDYGDGGDGGDNNRNNNNNNKRNSNSTSTPNNTHNPHPNYNPPPPPPPSPPPLQVRHSALQQLWKVLRREFSNKFAPPVPLCVIVTLCKRYGIILIYRFATIAHHCTRCVTAALRDACARACVTVLHVQVYTCCMCMCNTCCMCMCIRVNSCCMCMCNSVACTIAHVLHVHV